MGQAWMRKLEIADIWKNEEMTFEQRRDAIVARLKRIAPWANRHDAAVGEEGRFADIVDELRQTVDADDFDEVWSDLYDWADQDKRLWIELWMTKQPMQMEVVK